MNTGNQFLQMVIGDCMHIIIVLADMFECGQLNQEYYLRKITKANGNPPLLEKNYKKE